MEKRNSDISACSEKIRRWVNGVKILFYRIPFGSLFFKLLSVSVKISIAFFLCSFFYNAGILVKLDRKGYLCNGSWQEIFSFKRIFQFAYLFSDFNHFHSVFVSSAVFLVTLIVRKIASRKTLQIWILDFPHILVPHRSNLLRSGFILLITFVVFRQAVFLLFLNYICRNPWLCYLVVWKWSNLQYKTAILFAFLFIKFT